LAPWHVIAAECAGGALPGENFGGFPLLLSQGPAFGPLCRRAGVGGGGEQSGIGARKGGVDVWPVAPDRLGGGGGPVRGVGGVELACPLRRHFARIAFCPGVAVVFSVPGADSQGVLSSDHCTRALGRRARSKSNPRTPAARAAGSTPRPVSSANCASAPFQSDVEVSDAGSDCRCPQRIAEHFRRALMF